MTSAMALTVPRPRVRTAKALIDGHWHGELEQTPAVRSALKNAVEFRSRVSASNDSEYSAEPNRYHLYVSYACPWAHRTIIYRQLKGLEKVVSMSVVHPRWAGPDGWRFADTPMSTIDHAGNHRNLYEVYQAANPNFTGRVTVPVLWDRQTNTIVNNQSGDIIRMFNSEFDAWGDGSVNFYPAVLQEDIDKLNSWLLPNICGAVYRAGFASSQATYDDAIDTLFASLDQVEQRLQNQPYLHGDRITESDWHLFATLCRFDAVYYGALKCNLRRLSDYPALTTFTARVQETTGIGDTVRFDHIKHHYYDAIGEIEPTIVPRGPAVDYTRHVASPVVDSKVVEARSNSSETIFIKEIRTLHNYLERWMKGEVIDQRRGPTRLAKALANDFMVVHPNGTHETKKNVIRNFASAYGEKPSDYTLNIRDISVEILPGGYCLATYKESHGGEAGRTRLSCALLHNRSVQKDVEWLFLQETFTSD